MAIAPDGHSLAIAHTTSPVLAGGGHDPEPITLVVLDTATRRETRRVVVGEAGARPTWIDFDGDRAVVGLGLDGEPVSPVLVDLDGRLRIWPPAPASG